MYVTADRKALAIALIFLSLACANSPLTVSPAHAAPEQAAPLGPASLFFDRAATETVKPYRDSVLVTDANGAPKFRAGLPYILDVAGNREGYVIEWRLAAKRVRLSIDPKQDFWVACDDIISTGLSCGATRATPNGLILRAPEPKPPARSGPTPPPPGVPDCPGDVRCPKLNQRR